MRVSILHDTRTIFTVAIKVSTTVYFPAVLNQPFLTA
jgi:hypothetical protein